MATQLGKDNSSNNEHVAINIPGPEEVIDAAANELLGGHPRQLRGALFWVGASTIFNVLNRIVSKVPPGAIFEGHLIAYYLTLFGVFLAGVAEVYTAILLSKAQDGGRVRAYVVPLLCASVVLLISLYALGGSPVPIPIMG